MGSEIGNAVSLPHAVMLAHNTENDQPLMHTHTLTQKQCHIHLSALQSFLLLTHRVRLTVDDLDGDGLFLLDGLRVWEAGVADVVIPGILSEYIREVKVSIQGLGHPAALRQPLEV